MYSLASKEIKYYKGRQLIAELSPLDVDYDLSSIMTPLFKGFFDSSIKRKNPRSAAWSRMSG